MTYLLDRKNRRILKKTAVPTKNLPLVLDSEAGPSSRDIRTAGRRERENQSEPEVSMECEQDVEDEEDTVAAENMLTALKRPSPPTEPKFRDAEVQVNTSKMLTLCEFITTVLKF